MINILIVFGIPSLYIANLLRISLVFPAGVFSFVPIRRILPE